MWWSKTEQNKIDPAQERRDADNQAVLDSFGESLAIIQFSSDGTVLDANQNFLASMSYELSDIKGKHHRMFCRSDYVQSTEYSQFWLTLARGKPFTAECLRVDKHGSDVWLEASYCPVRDKQGEVYKIVKIASDITENIEQKHELRGQVEGLNRSMATIEFNLDGTIRLANDNFLSTMGYTLEEIKGRHHRMFCPPEIANSDEYRHFWRSLNQGEYQQNIYQRINKAGENVWLEASYNPIFNSKQQLVKIMKTARDITETVNSRTEAGELAL